MAPANVDPRAILPIPTICPHCGSDVDFVNNSKIYGKEFGDWPWAYLCRNKVCDSYIGVHSGTRHALGTLADAPTRAARKTAHSAFDQIWKTKTMKRGEAYRWLAKELDIEPWRCHIGWFGVGYCKQVTKLATSFLQQRNVCRPKQSHPADAYF